MFIKKLLTELKDVTMKQKLSGFYPRKAKRFIVQRQPEGGYCIVYMGMPDFIGDQNPRVCTMSYHRKNISTRKDAENQCVSLNFRYRMVYS